MSKPKEYSFMTQNKLMTYTFVALLIIAVISAALWSQVTDSGWNLGLTVGLVTIIAVGVAVGLDWLLYKLASDSPLNTMSAAVFGMIVALSYSLGVPGMAITSTTDAVPKELLSAPNAFLYVALISLIGLVVFKKMQGLRRKYVNPAAAAKFLVLIPFISTVFLAKDHFASYTSGGFSVPLLAGPIGNTVIKGNGLASFASYLQSCYWLPNFSPTGTYPPISQIMILEKFHGWVGGASSLAVIIVGIALFAIARRYIKWRITTAYFVTVVLMSLLMTVAYGGDAYVRLMFELFIGSSIFMAFFMATDPASTPLTYLGQGIFGVGLGVLTVLIQTYMNFFGGALLALLVMNLFSSRLDRIGLLKPIEGKVEPKLPKAQQFTSVRTIACMRCGACMRVCCHKLSPILIKEAFDKQKIEALVELKADLCDGCGHCSFVCPVRLDLKGSVLRSKAMLRSE
jgi:Na+-translocating ferredoxin:NAD+ oxidoreductase RnfD subunit/NAD-dependent dihydropyrimidine dehydrogenase PreA subunit